MNINSDISKLKGIGEKTKEGFLGLGIETVDNLLHYYPRTYDKYEYISKISEICDMERFAINGTVIANPKLVKFSGKTMLTVLVSDGGEDILEIKYFNANYLLKTLKKGANYVFRGYVKLIGKRFMMSQPKMFKPEEYQKLEGTIAPIYSINKEISNNRIEKAVKEALTLKEYEDEYLDANELKANKLININDSIRSIHFPDSEEALGNARRRIIFEEFLSFIDMIKSDESNNQKLINDTPFIEVSDCRILAEKLPYSLTNAQKRTIEEIFTDMTSDKVMNRLVQGDVGSGKTIVAIMALLLCAANGYQGAMMAPTEVLARQHYENIEDMVRKYCICLRPVLLTGKTTAKNRREVLEKIKSGEANVIIGTHALFQDKVEFKNLKLVITDEQHRFGVSQREELRDKGLKPHILVMSATPIPRTLAMIVFGNLDISIMDELPKNRIPIQNCVVSSNFRKKAYEKIESEVKNGHQAYVICPMIDESEEDNINLKNVTDHTKELQSFFGDRIRVTCLHGKMKQDQKNRIMDDFKSGLIDVLVSTTVVEVGVDVSNATVMIIENSERFGLSQLHQLRGRIGRSTFDSYCIMISDSKNQDTIERLKILNQTNDGFEIAKKDMQLRGPGELAGVRQSGALNFSLGDVIEDSDILMLASNVYESVKDRIKNRKSRLKIDYRTI